VGAVVKDATAAVLAAVERHLAPAASVPAVEPPEVMTVREVAAFLRLDRKTVYDAAARGDLPSRRVGRRVLVSRAALDAWLASGGR
jgi:excisionase family DNA binding protein